MLRDKLSYVQRPKIHIQIEENEKQNERKAFQTSFCIFSFAANGGVLFLSVYKCGERQVTR